MIPAQKSRLFSAAFARHARGRIRGTFGRVLVRGLDEARAASRGGPLLVVVNHTSWWDALVVLALSQLELGADGYALMDAANLERLPFFARVGAFGVDLEDPRDGARAIRYAARLLDRPGRIVWVFPEGRERSPFEPLELLPGAAQIGRVARGASLVGVGVRYVFGEREQPDLALSIGAPEAPARDAAEGVRQQRDAIARELSRVDEALAARSFVGFAELHAREPGALARLAERLLAAMTPLSRERGRHALSSRTP